MRIRTWLDMLFNKRRMGLIPQLEDKRDYKYLPTGVVLDKVDLFVNDYPIRQQSPYNSCVGHSAAYLMARFMDGILPDTDYYEKYVNVSEAFIWVMAKEEEGTISQNVGVVARDAFKVIKKYGFIGRSYFDFKDGAYKLPSDDVLALANMQKMVLSYLPSYRGINSYLTKRIQYIKDAISSGSPVSLAIPVDSAFLKYNGGIISSVDSKLVGYHDVVIGGYDIIDGQVVFKGRNSWGRYWGEKGYFYVTEKFLYDNAFDIWTLQ